jgi:glycosyltransferase involved in cell wall biosynthesis
MKVVLITGSYPPDICGVAEYTERLAEALEKAGAKVILFTGKNWSPANAFELNREIGGLAADVLHMQYPATGYGWHLGPQVLSLLRPFVTTIHECSQTHILRRLSLFPFTVRAQKIIFTNEYEQVYSRRFAPWIEDRSTVVPIGNGIPQGSDSVDRLPKVVTNFGLIRPRKGLEDVIEMARLFKERANGLSVRIVGTILPGYEDYYERLRKEANDLPVQWALSLNGAPLSHALAETEVAYLPFPDGASERRSSLIAMLANKSSIITTHGVHTPSAMEKAVQFAGSPTEAVALAEDLFNNPRRLEATQSRAEEYAARFSWSSIAAEHMAIYQQLVGPRA